MNKKERMLAVFRNEPTDKVPAGFWFHYRPEYTVQEMIDAHLRLFRETDMDVIKIMQDYAYPVKGTITCAEDWRHIQIEGTDSETFRKMRSIIQGIRREAGEDVLIFQTMFGPFKAASMTFGDDVLMQYARSDPDAVREGVQILADGLQAWAEGFLDAGADGIYYSAQFGEQGRFEKEEWEKLVKPFDLQILNVAAARENKYNMLHICGEPEYRFRTHVEWFADYPGDIVNWSVKDNHISLREGEKIFRRPVLGGLNNKGNVLKGTTEAIQAEVEGVLKGYGTRGMMIGADCTIQGEHILMENIASAVAEAHANQNGLQVP